VVTALGVVDIARFLSVVAATICRRLFVAIRGDP
jgi:hypothetical protein